MVIFDTAKNKDFDELKALWDDVFKEDPTFSNKFFSTRFFPEHIFCARENNKIVASLHALPYTYQKEGKIYNCSYIVGAATAPTHRKQGLMEKLLNNAKENYNHPMVLFPAIRPYYEKRGYFTTTHLHYYKLQDLDFESSLKEESLNFDQLNSIYNEVTKEVGSVTRDEIAWQFLVDGYELVTVKDAYAFIKYNNAIETAALTDEAAKNLLAILIQKKLEGICVFENSPFTKVIKKERDGRVPMGMATDKILEGVYITEQY